MCNLVPLASIIPPFDTPRPRKRLKPHKGRIYFSESILAFLNFPEKQSSIWRSSSSIELHEWSSRPKSVHTRVIDWHTLSTSQALNSVSFLYQVVWTIFSIYILHCLLFVYTWYMISVHWILEYIFEICFQFWIHNSNIHCLVLFWVYVEKYLYIYLYIWIYFEIFSIFTTRCSFGYVLAYILKYFQYVQHRVLLCIY